MKKDKLFELVEKLYINSKEDFAHWMWANHLKYVVNNAQLLSDKYHSNSDLTIAGALIHDLGDAFLGRHENKFEEITRKESLTVLKQASYSEKEITEILDTIVQPHPCKENNLPTTLEGKILATADALAHLNSDFYIQFAWMHLPQGKTYTEYIKWVNEKLNRDFNIKIFFKDEKEKIQDRHKSLLDIFKKSDNI